MKLAYLQVTVEYELPKDATLIEIVTDEEQFRANPEAAVEFLGLQLAQGKTLSITVGPGGLGDQDEGDSS